MRVWQCSLPQALRQRFLAVLRHLPHAAFHSTALSSSDARICFRSYRSAIFAKRAENSWNCVLYRVSRSPTASAVLAITSNSSLNSLVRCR